MVAKKEDEDFIGAARVPTNTFLNFSFFKVDPKWRWLNDLGKEEAAKEFSTLIEIANTKLKVLSYSTVGLRDNADFMLWIISDNLEKMQVLASKIHSTVFGKYINTTSIFLSVARQSIYSGIKNASSERSVGATSSSQGKATPEFIRDLTPMKYLVVYPFVKSREWYLLPLSDRRKMMNEHIAIGKKFVQIRLNTSYSFGLDDQDFMLAFETEDLLAFQALVMQLRETEVSRYVVRDTPINICVYKGVEEIIKSLG